MSTYTITVNENQARIIAYALELMSRIQMGQWTEFVNWLPHQGKFCRHSLREQLQPAMAEHFRKTKPAGMFYPIDGWGSHYGIHSEVTPDMARTAWDLRRVIEHRLAWDRDPEVGGEPLAIIKRVEDQLPHGNHCTEAGGGS